ncbi:MAG: hybrid sensor histidine kinase/response regulator [Xenococcaceae cyanobacterium MO_234.B1]|nr:hybrid sensor histidine kinase/response regulator [Xenococcaceae cyanobacterium MO_234.B1]
MVSDFRPRESYQFFLQEAVELLQSLEQGLLEIREDHSTQKIHNLMRTAHSIKGGAACVGLNHIKKIAHDLENAFKILYQDGVEIDFELEELLLQAYDRLKSPLLAEIHQGAIEPEDAIAKAEPVLQELAAKLKAQSNKKRIRDFPFAREISQGIDRLSVILSSPDETDILEALKAQFTIFRSLAELSGIADFLTIANATLEQLENHPESVISIGEKALADFHAAYQVVTKIQKTHSDPVSETEKVSSFVLHSATSNSLHNSPRNVAEGIIDRQSDQEPQELEEACSEASSPLSDLLEDRSSDRSRSEGTPLISPIQEVRVSASYSNSQVVESSSGKIPTTTNNQTTDNQTFTDAKTTKDQLIPENGQKLPSLALGIRINASRLELLHNLVGELVTEDNRFLLQNQQNGETLASLNQWYNRFKQLSQNLKRWADRLPNDGWQSELVINEALFRNNSNTQYLKASLQNILEELAQLGEGLQDLAFLEQSFEKIRKNRQKTAKKIQNNLLQASMLPIGELLCQFPRTVRDMAIRNNKQVKLELQGKKTLIDKAILEKLYDPLVHLLRNAIAHGIETPEIRHSLNKPPQGKVVISVCHQGNHTYIEVKDDGRGIDWQKIRESLINKNILSVTEARNLPKSRLSEFLFDSGFSTANKVSTLAGRGMGLSAVKQQIQSLKGTITVKSKLNVGTTFIIRLPLTLTIVKLLVFSIAGNLLAIPVDSLASIVLADKKDIQREADQKYYQWQGQQVTICPETLLSSYRYPRTVDPSKPLCGKDWQDSHKIPLLLLSNGTEIVALRIEQILMEQDLVIKPFEQAIAPPASLIGCTLLGDGRLIPVLNSVAVVDKWLQFSEGNIFLPPALNLPTLPTILVVDDSLTIRQTLSTTLRKAGYRVIQCRDGIEGVEKLKREEYIQAVISDIEMPRMNGLEFLSRTRQLRGTSLPVIMLTSRISNKYRQIAQNLGATRYLTKPFVDRELLDALEECLGRVGKVRLSGYDC